MAKKVRSKLIGVVILLVGVVSIIGCYPYVKGELYKMKVIKAIAATRVEGTTDEMEDFITVDINSEESKGIIVDAFKNATWRLRDENYTTPVVENDIKIGAFKIYYVKRQLEIDDGSLYVFFLEAQDRAKIDNLIKSLELEKE